jgi:hypothetical protein
MSADAYARRLEELLQAETRATEACTKRIQHVAYSTRCGYWARSASRARLTQSQLTCTSGAVAMVPPFGLVAGKAELKPNA